MKKRILLAFFSTVYFFAEAQYLNTDGSNSMSGTLKIRKTSTYSAIELESNVGAYIDFKNDLSQDYGGRIIWNLNNSNRFDIYGMTYFREKATFEGAVGIGTFNPLWKLEVSGADDTYATVRSLGSNSLAGFGLVNDSRTWVLRIEGEEQDKFQIRDANANAQRLTIDTNGNVGIGVTSPREKLEVNGAIQLKAMEPIYFLSGQSDPNYLIQSGEWNDGMKYKHWTSHQFFTGGQEKVRISQQGNLLIAKTSQTNASYKIDVAGKMRADEIVVNTDGADYVFTENYMLRPLAEVEQFIEENNHLPGISSAAEMQEKGMSVGELNTKLLEKIEELTLYMIELKKENESLKSRVEKLER